MPDEALPPVEPELLVATFSPQGTLLYRNEAWINTFGDTNPPWERLSQEDGDLATRYVGEAAGGLLVTNQLFFVHTPAREEPLPALLHFLPVFRDWAAMARSVQAVMVTGEMLTAPGSWMASQTLRHRMETLGRMTMGIAHDFNNLLSSILGHLELLKSAWPGEAPAYLMDEHLHPVEQAALDGAALVRKIQQYIRQEKEATFEPVDLPTLIRDVAMLTKPYWYNEPRLQGIAIDLELDLDPVPPIMGLAAELRDVFVNLILNAVQAMPQGGHITIRTRHEPERGVVVHLADTGTGIPERIQARIFEPLFTTKGQRGTGMGLAVCYGIVQEHDGSIEVQSRLGQGTVFILTFPPAHMKVLPPPSGEPPPPQRRARILIVDDEPGVRTVLAKLLALKGHEARVAGSGSEALALAEREPFDLVITDQGMPEMNGRQLARALRRRFPDLPVLLLTGDTDAGEADESVSAVHAKPFRIDQLNSLIQALLAS
ncbi:response regulator [Rhodocaloribacter litoris]|uniref:hybrid sensor histidine kinase/response regulator n=1 Tax=Rhodocaloribacter litoris TaxID=2558931 RepID=UPI0014201E3D|nr:ATP-binding protein [Rhodocaloribacter litoris]QXD15691.1 response regulator [Rhodocaloribacter litoris]